MKLRRLNLESKRGQTLIEVLIAIAVAVMIIVAIVTLLNASNRRAALSRQSTQASKIAEETLDIIRNIRDVNAPALGIAPTAFSPAIIADSDPAPWDGDGCNSSAGLLRRQSLGEFFSNSNLGGNHDGRLWGAPCSPQYGVTAHLHSPNDLPTDPSCHPSTSTESWCIHFNDPGSAINVVVENVTYTREIYVADSPPAVGGLSKCNSVLDSFTEKQFTVIVKWDSPIGPQQRVATTCLVRPL
jgi:type II secretory pathway pseudopilin PulG